MLSYARFVLSLALSQRRMLKAGIFAPPSYRSTVPEDTVSDDAMRSTLQIAIGEMARLASVLCEVFRSPRLLPTGLFLILIAPLLLKRARENKRRWIRADREEASSFIYTMH